MSNEKKVRLTFYISPADKFFLEKVRQDSGVTVAETVRRIVSDWIETAIREKIAPPPSPSCEWRYIHDGYDGLWRSECGVEFVLADGTPGDNNMVYCIGCGRPLVEVVT